MLPSVKAYFVAKTLDDVMREVVDEIDTRGSRIHPRKGEADEITGVLIELSNPRARLSRTETRGKIFSALGELCWYLSGSRRTGFITYYLRDYAKLAEGNQVYGGYGPRFFTWKGTSQISNIVATLRRRDSRRAVIQLFDARDIAKRHKDVPCTCTLQFLLRRHTLHLIANMRSNDVHRGLPHDVFCFTMLQEIMARRLSVELGTYKHVVGSLHRYVEDREPMKQFRGEGYQPTAPTMPPMPPGNPWPAVKYVLAAESAIRRQRAFDETKLDRIDPYWADLVRLLQVFGAQKKNDSKKMADIRGKMSSTAYFPFIDRMIRKQEVS